MPAAAPTRPLVGLLNKPRALPREIGPPWWTGEEASDGSLFYRPGRVAASDTAESSAWTLMRDGVPGPLGSSSDASALRDRRGPLPAECAMSPLIVENAMEFPRERVCPPLAVSFREGCAGPSSDPPKR